MYLDFFRLESQKSPLIPLIKNNYYYVEGLHKELFGTDNFAVGVIFPNGTRNTPISEKYCYHFFKSSTYHGNLFFIFNTCPCMAILGSHLRSCF